LLPYPSSLVWRYPSPCGGNLGGNRRLEGISLDHIEDFIKQTLDAWDPEMEFSILVDKNGVTHPGRLSGSINLRRNANRSLLVKNTAGEVIYRFPLKALKS
jgi:hypothetical protein